jgi:hypothetical protein
MKLKRLIGPAIALMLGWYAGAQTYDTNGNFVQTFAGSGFSGYVDGVGQQTMFNNPSSIVSNTSSNLFILDNGNYRIRKISPDGTVSTFAGGGNLTTGYGTNVSLYYEYFGSMAIDHSNVLWITALDFGGGDYLLRVGADAFVSRAHTNHVYYSATVPPYVSGVCVDSQNNVYYSDYTGNRIWQITPTGSVNVFAGSGNVGSADGNWIFSSFYEPGVLACDAADNIYVWDTGNTLMRRINQNRDVATLAGGNGSTSVGGPYVGIDIDGVGTNAGFRAITGICADNAGNLILTSSSSSILPGNSSSSVRKMSATTNVVTLAGSFTQIGYTNGVGSLARFQGANGVCVAGGTIYVADSRNQRIRSITFNPTSQVVLPANLLLNTYPGLQITGTVGRTYQIQTSSDLNTWSTVAAVLLTSNPYWWIDQNPVSGKKFYRALLLP